MLNSDQLEILLTITPRHATLQELRAMRLELFIELEQRFAGENVELSQAPDGRALDPDIVGTIGLVLLPVLVDNLLDLLKEWVERRTKDVTITLKFLDPQGGEKTVTFNPYYHTVDEIKQLLDSQV